MIISESFFCVQIVVASLLIVRYVCLPIWSCDICIAPIFPRESSTSNLCDFGLGGPFPIKMALGNRPKGIFDAQRIGTSLRGQVDWDIKTMNCFGFVHKWRRANLDNFWLPPPPIITGFITKASLYCRPNSLIPLALRPLRHLRTTHFER